MPANLNNNPMYLAALDLLDALDGATVHIPDVTYIRKELDVIQQRLTYIASLPDSASHYCKVINDQVVGLAERALALGLDVENLNLKTHDVSPSIEAAAAQLAKESFQKFSAFSLLCDFKRPRLGGDIQLRNAYGAANDGVGDAYLEACADYLRDLQALTQMTPMADADEALDLRKLTITVNEGWPDNQRSSISMVYNLGEHGVSRSNSVEMTLPELSEGFVGLNSRGFYAPDIPQTEAVKAFRQRFYEGDPSRDIAPICKNDREGLLVKLTEAVQLATDNVDKFTPQVNDQIDALKQEIREVIGESVAPLTPLKDIGITDSERDAFYMQ